MSGLVARGEDEAVGRLFSASMHITWSWLSPSVLRNYLARADVGVNPSQYQALVLIAAAGPVRLSEVAAGAGMTASNASKVVNDLVGAGLVTRTVPTTDRRVTLLAATEEGRRAVGDLERVGRQMLAERLDGFTADEVDVLGRLLERLASVTEGWTSSLSEIDGEELDQEGEGAA